MNIKVWSTALLILCLCPAAMAQKANRYLEKPLPQGWGKDASHAIPGDDNLFSGQIPPLTTSGGKPSMTRCWIH